jgi:uncharacterized protein (DUF1697 family)
MTRYVAFLRAINVGSHLVKMDRLRALFEELGFANVKTFIASGNVLFETAAKDPAALELKIAKALRKALGYDVAVFLRTGAELNDVCVAAGEVSDGTLFVGFLPTVVDASERKLIVSMTTSVDELRASNREVYWRASQNFSGAMFQPAKMEKKLGKPATFRNVTTVRKIAALMGHA